MDARNSVWPQFLAGDDYEESYVFLGGEYTSFPAKEFASFWNTLILLKARWRRDLLRPMPLVS